MFRFFLVHDRGISTLSVPAATEEAAIQKIMAAELCPRSAITPIPKA